MQEKRLNWIMYGMQLLFGVPANTAPLVPINRVGLYQQITLLVAWNTEGVACGFIPATLGGATGPNVVVDSDFQPTWPAITAAVFLTAVGTLQTLSNDWMSGYTNIVPIKP